MKYWGKKEKELWGEAQGIKNCPALFYPNHLQDRKAKLGIANADIFTCALSLFDQT